MRVDWKGQKRADLSRSFKGFTNIKGLLLKTRRYGCFKSPQIGVKGRQSSSVGATVMRGSMNEIGKR